MKQRLGKVIIIGATSAIAYETGKLLADDKAELFLVARNADKLKIVADDLRSRGAKKVEAFQLDVNELDQHPVLVDAAMRALGSIDAVLIAHGTLGDQQASEKSVTVTLNELNTNFLSVVSLLTLLANYFEGQKRGCLAVISSVAGDRGRQTNYVYGTAKGGLNIFLQGLRSRMFRVGVAVVTIKPGMVDTPMTAGLKKSKLFTTAPRVGKAIYKAMANGSEVRYVPWFWWGVMMILRNIPERIFKKMNLKA